MKKNLIYLFVSLFTFLSCNDGAFEDGYVDLSKGYMTVEEDTYKVYTLNHPCLMHTNADFQYVVKKIEAKAEPWTGAWEYLKNHSYTQLNDNWTNNAPELLERNPYQNGQWEGNFKTAIAPGLAAYYLALRWKIGKGLGEQDAYKYADKAMKILDNWSAVCKAIKVEGSHEHYALVTGFDGYRFTQSAEILRDYEPWVTSGGFDKFKTWLKEVVCGPAAYFMSFKTDPYWSWGGWEVPNMGTMLAVGIVCDDQDIINYVLNFYKHGTGSGCIGNLVVALHKDPAGLGEGYCLGQADESGRDQDHAGLSMATLAPLCQAAYNIGEDLFGIKANDTFTDKEGVQHYRYPKYAEYGDVNLTLAFFEYYAKFNVDPLEAIEMPFTYWETRVGPQNEVAFAGRGHFYAGWELIYNHYANIKGVKAPYSKKFAEKNRSGHSEFPYEFSTDFPGIGTLMFYKGE